VTGGNAGSARERLGRAAFGATCALLAAGVSLGILQSLEWSGRLPTVELGYSWYLDQLEERGEDERVLRELAMAQIVDLQAAHIAYNKTGVRLLERGDAVGAEASFRAALAIVPDYSDALANLANALTAQQRYDEAVEHLKQALELKPRWPRARRNLREIRRLRDADRGGGEAGSGPVDASQLRG
jgi:tetratricopeptide (TPR) repeat protein